MSSFWPVLSRMSWQIKQAIPRVFTRSGFCPPGGVNMGHFSAAALAMLHRLLNGCLLQPGISFLKALSWALLPCLCKNCFSPKCHAWSACPGEISRKSMHELHIIQKSTPSSCLLKPTLQKRLLIPTLSLKNFLLVKSWFSMAYDGHGEVWHP